MSRKDYLKIKCWELMFDWECLPCWYTFAHVIELFIMDAFVDLFITLCIVVNTVFMAMDHAGMSEQMANTLIIGNYVNILSPYLQSSNCLIKPVYGKELYV